MSTANAKDAADAILAGLRLTEQSTTTKFQLVVFNDEEDCRFFYPRRALDWQRQVNTYISRALRRRGIRVNRITIAPSHYNAWIGDRDDSPELRREFADKHLHFLGENARPAETKLTT